MLASAAATHEGSRKPVRDVCIRFSDEYWRDPDEGREYPEEFAGAPAGSGSCLSFSYVAGNDLGLARSC